MTRFGATTNPLPSSTFWQLGATPRIFTTLPRVASTTGDAASAASGASTATIGVRLKGSSTAGSPEVSSRFASRVGTFFSHSGATASTSLSTFEPRTDRPARVGWLVSGVASSQAATSTVTSCRPRRSIESTARRPPVADGAAHRAAQHHTGDLTDHH